ncbi:MAG: hypothetical protein SFZ23_07590 [Planctomycetota bacterium]|nr:hypothetical protein [Planctomycetota bacterium]
MNSDRDILISRVVDGTALASDWAAIESLARVDASLWRDVAMAQSDASKLGAAVREQAARADLVAFPSTFSNDAPLPLALAGDIATTDGGGWRMGRRTWLGWVAAAVLLVAFVIERGRQPDSNPGSGGGEITAGWGGINADAEPQAYLDRYLEKGKDQGLVVGEVPERVLLETTPAADGQGFWVVYIRQIMERQRVPDLYKFRMLTDDSGRIIVEPVPVPGVAPGSAVGGKSGAM